MPAFEIEPHDILPTIRLFLARRLGAGDEVRELAPNPRDDRRPVARRRLAKEPGRRIPRAILALDEPAPVGLAKEGSTPQPRDWKTRDRIGLRLHRARGSRRCASLNWPCCALIGSEQAQRRHIARRALQAHPMGAVGGSQISPPVQLERALQRWDQSIRPLARQTACFSERRREGVRRERDLAEQDMAERMGFEPMIRLLSV